jgi:hypothetical protein
MPASHAARNAFVQNSFFGSLDLDHFTFTGILDPLEVLLRSQWRQKLRHSIWGVLLDGGNPVCGTRYEDMDATMSTNYSI